MGDIYFNEYGDCDTVRKYVNAVIVWVKQSQSPRNSDHFDKDGEKHSSVRISTADADRILAENKRSGFLNNGNVVFLLDK